MNKAKILLTLLSTVLPLFVAAQDFLNLRELTDKTTTAELPPNTAEVVFIAATSDLVVTSSHPSYDRFDPPVRNGSGQYEYNGHLDLSEGMGCKYFKIQKRGTAISARTPYKTCFHSGERHCWEVSEPQVKFYLRRDGNAVHLAANEGCVEITSPRPVLKLSAPEGMPVQREEKVNAAAQTYVTTLKVGTQWLMDMRKKLEEHKIDEEEFQEQTTLLVSFENSNVEMISVAEMEQREKHIYSIICIDASYAGKAKNDGVTKEETITVSENGQSEWTLDVQNCGQLIKDVDGNTYNTVQIGEQCWMKENLRTTHYADGTAIPQGSSAYTSKGCWFYPNNNSSTQVTYGLLYNWKAVMHDDPSSNRTPSGVQGICPKGWHVPSDREWKQMEIAVGMSQHDAGLSEQYRGNIAAKLCGNAGWRSSDIANAAGNLNAPDRNATDFSALPAGLIGSGNFFGDILSFWSTTDHDSYCAYLRRLNYDRAGVLRTSGLQTSGCSVRCIRD